MVDVVDLCGDDVDDLTHSPAERPAKRQKHQPSLTHVSNTADSRESATHVSDTVHNPLQAASPAAAEDAEAQSPTLSAEQVRSAVICSRSHYQDECLIQIAHMQQKVEDLVRQGENVFFTGNAGTGFDIHQVCCRRAMCSLGTTLLDLNLKPVNLTLLCRKVLPVKSHYCIPKTRVCRRLQCKRSSDCCHWHCCYTRQWHNTSLPDWLRNTAASGGLRSYVETDQQGQMAQVEGIAMRKASSLLKCTKLLHTCMGPWQPCWSSSSLILCSVHERCKLAFMHEVNQHHPTC